MVRYRHWPSSRLNFVVFVALAKQILGIALPVVRPCLSVCHTFGLFITFLPEEMGLSYLAFVFLMTRPF